MTVDPEHNVSLKLLLMRHGDAEAHASLDSERTLSSGGRETVALRAKQLRSNGYQIDYLVSSPYVRTVETASIIAEKVGIKEVLISEALTPGREPDEAITALEPICNRDNIVMAVLHQPLISRLIEYLSEVDQPISTADIAVIEAPVLAKGCCRLICML